MFAPTYLDYNATAPLEPLVLEAMLPYLSTRFGNPSSRHEYGRHARQAVDTARQQVAAAVGAHPTEVLFTSGGSEANNLFLKGAASARKPGLLVTGATEHPCVREPAKQLRKLGWRHAELAVDAQGQVHEAAYAALLAEQPALISVMLANNETGVIQDIAALASRSKPCRAWFHSDAVQALGKYPLNFRTLNQAGVHAISLSAHKLGGPLGAGALVVDKRVELAPLIAGGGQERNIRSGTENVPAIVGFGRACELALTRLETTRQRLQQLRHDIERGVSALGATIFGAQSERLPNTVFFAFPDLDGETLVGQMDRAGFALASGSACSSTNPEPSHVLLAMGVAPSLAKGAVRVSLGANTVADDVFRFLNTLNSTVSRLKGLSALAG